MAGRTTFVVLCLASLLLADRVGAENRLEIESGPGRAGPITWQAAELAYRPAAAADLPSRWRLKVGALEWGDWRGELSVECARGGLSARRPWCHEGAFEWQGRDGSGQFAGRVRGPEAHSDLALSLDDGSLEASLTWADASAGQGVPDIRVKLAGFDLADLPGRLLEALGLSVLEGRVNGQIAMASGELTFDLELEDCAFDRPDGLVAGAGLAVAFIGRVDGLTGSAPTDFSSSLAQRAGELLLGPVYLPPPERPLKLDVAGTFAAGRRIDLESLSLDDGGLVEAAVSAALDYSEDGWRLVELALD
ncbi:MAG TPA: hypothetical protein VK972_03310, partial [Wenzhouxiangella sp.]|nr:hypothetical protein [Wenzhouxiangella sp.]